MDLPELVVPVLTTAGSVGLVYVIMRNLPQVAKALLMILAAFVFMFARDETLRQRGSDVLDKLTDQDDDRGNSPSSLPKPLVCAYRAASCFLISATSASGLSALIVAVGVPLGRAHHTVCLAVARRTAQMSHFGNLGRRIASC
jgi:hypothetical protein